ncbi:hypothetical protein BASA61_000563 [Batrachochytrium salamandrivorans]|nr:hypothetical protein BASA61_000563 [Batrachochytrium salamandrivorans]
MSRFFDNFIFVFLQITNSILKTNRNDDYKRRLQATMSDCSEVPLLSLNMCAQGAVDSELLAMNRSIRVSMRPMGKEVLAFAVARVPVETLPPDQRAKLSQQRFPQDQQVHLASWQSIPESRSSFYQAALGVFESADSIELPRRLHSRHSKAGRLDRLSEPTRNGSTAAASAASTAFAAFASSSTDATAAPCPSNAELLAIISRASSDYRRAIYSHVRSLEAQTHTLGASSSAGSAALAGGEPDLITDHGLAEIQQETALFSAIHSVWHLAHILFFDDQQQQPHVPAKSVLADLITWLTLNHTYDIQSQFEEMVAMVSPSDHPEFWPYIFKCLLRGHFVAATTMLGLLKAYKPAPSMANPTQSVNDVTAGSNPVVALTLLAQRMPTASTTSGSQAIYQQKWDQWKDDAVFLYADGMMSSLLIREADKASFAIAFGILAGDETVVLQTSQTWQEAMIGLGVFVYPQFQAQDVKSLLAIVVERYAVDTLLDQVQLALLELDIPKALRYASDLDWWLVTHLIDLFDRAGMLKELDLLDLHTGGVGSDVGDSGCSLAEWYLLTYADSLSATPHLWRVALEYYVYCPRYGMDMLAQLIPRFSLDSNVKARKLLAFCDTHGLMDTKRQLHHILGRRSLSEERFGEAIAHYIDAGQDRIVTTVCDQVLSSFLNHTEVPSTFFNMMASLNPALLHLHSRLAFLHRHYSFHQLYAAKEFRQAGALLVTLLTSSVTPKLYLRHLLLDSLPLLESELLIFSTKDTFELMRCLEAVSAQDLQDQPRSLLSTSETSQPSKSVDSRESANDVLRLALSRNLSRSMLFQ